MVEAVVSFAVEKLGEALIRETFFLLNVRSQVKELRDELRRMRCFLKDADAKQQQGDERVRNWVADIRDVAYDAEDAIDTFILKIDHGAPKSGGIRNIITRKALMVKNLKHLYRVGKEIQAIRSRLKVISDSRVTYGINDLHDNESSKASRMMQQQLRNDYIHVEDEDIIGLEKHAKTLLTELVKDDERRCVISIVGVGGLGKTTLAKKLYKHDTVMSRFDCRSWSSISQQFNPRDALLELIKKSMNLHDWELSKIKELNERYLTEKLYHYLQDKRYFVVVDDLWSFEDWNSLSPAFPNGKRGSKILLTTRKKDVASQADPWSLQFEPQLLNDDDSWELLCKKAFPKNMRDANYCYPAVMEKLGREMVRKCGGLPLAICVLGGILATRRAEIKEWEYVNRDISSHINKGKYGGVSGILALSYNDLPVHLKPCFLFLGLFSEDYVISRKKLIQLWIAEGFIPHTKDDVLVTMEDVAKHQYYAELMQRCMIQAGKWGKTCQMHDLMRDLCLLKAKEMNFLDIYDHQINDVTSYASRMYTCRRPRRYAIHSNDRTKRYDDFYFNNSACTLRTLLIEISPGSPFAPLSYQHIKLLRVLDLENVRKLSNTCVTKEVSQLIHLRYLALGMGELDIPIWSSIGNLRNLQTLKLCYFSGLILSERISDLAQLRHLEIGSGEFTEDFRVENLMNLQILKYVEAGNWIRRHCFGKLSKLRKLWVGSLSRTQTDVLIHEIVNMNSSSNSSFNDQYLNPIRALRIHSNDDLNSNIFGLLSCCHNLHRLELFGRLDVLYLQKYPPNLSKLSLNGSMLNEDPMETLQYLPNLKYLGMDKTYTGKEMVCSTKGFPQLEVLRIYGFKGLNKLTVDKGGMPRLKELCLSDLNFLDMLPEGLRFMTTLQILNIYGMARITNRVAREIGQDWYKVQHIPSLIVKDR
ncbi:hypothetical protein MKW92_028288 [Papaver armeniacum]|nr:hypothetical protein MKW92_028288 [Papaver armeniacum]